MLDSVVQDNIHTVSGGCCDCGDAQAWKQAGFCKKHAGNASTKGIYREEKQDTRINTTLSNNYAHLFVPFLFSISLFFCWKTPSCYCRRAYTRSLLWWCAWCAISARCSSNATYFLASPHILLIYRYFIRYCQMQIYVGRMINNCAYPSACAFACMRIPHSACCGTYGCHFVLP